MCYSEVMTTTDFSTWLDTFLQEKGIDPDTPITVEGPSGPNHMTVGILTDAIKVAPASERADIKTTLVRIDFANGNPMHFFTHIAQAIAI